MSDAKVYLRLSGGLGNQLFQFASALYVARTNGIPLSCLTIETRFLSSYETKRDYSINFIANLFPDIKVGTQVPLHVSIAMQTRLAKIINRKIGSFNFLSSLTSCKYDCNDIHNTTTVIMDGYFQNPNYLFFAEDRDFIRKTLLNKKSEIINKIKGNQVTTGIHVRRGDYIKSDSASKIFRVIPFEYYEIALSTIGGNQKILIFSDDSDISNQIALKIGGITVHSLNLSLEDEFCLFMSCDNYVIANSTFSWWASYLGFTSAKRVIAPKSWFKRGYDNRNNLLLLSNFELLDN